MELALHSINPFESVDMFPVSDDILPLDVVFLESFIQSNLRLDVGSVMTKSNLELLNKIDLSIDRSPSFGLIESLNSPFDQQVSDPDEFDFFL